MFWFLKVHDGNENDFQKFIERTIVVLDIMFKHGFFILPEWQGTCMEEYATEFENFKRNFFSEESLRRCKENLSVRWDFSPKCMYYRKSGAKAEDCGLNLSIDFTDFSYMGKISGHDHIDFKFYRNYLFTPLIIDPYSTRIEWNIEGYNLNKGRIPKLVHEIDACHDWQQGYNENEWDRDDDSVYYNGDDIFVSLSRIREEFDENPPEEFFDVDAYIEKYSQK